MGMIRWLIILRELTKFKISIFAMLSTCAGFILAKGEVSQGMASACLGILLLSGGSCALNQCQERRIDGMMERTKGRPLPAGKITLLQACVVALSLIAAGSSILFRGSGSLAGELGLISMLWYNGVYLYLKRKTPFAVVPGALIGAIPPALGWVAGGGSLNDPRIAAVGFFFFIWQIPHSWLLWMQFAEDYDNAGLPSLARVFTGEQVKGIIFFWILSSAASCLLIPLFLPLNFYIILFFLLAITLQLVWSSLKFFRSPWGIKYAKNAFINLNIYALLVISLLSLDRLLPSYNPNFILIRKIFSGS